MSNEKRNCNQICRWNDSSDGCIKPYGRNCPMSNTEPDASGWGQVQVANEKRLIDANALMDAFRSYMVERYDSEKCVSDENCNTCEHECLWRRTVKNAPTVDAVEVVHGEWMEDYETFVDDSGKESYPIQTGYVCSECGVDGSPIWRYCPHCGAKMDGGNEDG